MQNFNRARINRAVKKVVSLAGPKFQTAFYRFGSEAFSREIAAMTAGINSHNRSERKNKEVYMLRRHVHMIEKGLTMRPRRDQFAANYIEDTVTAWAYLRSTDQLSISEKHWAEDVLASYFSVIVVDQDPRLYRASALFSAEIRDTSPRPSSGPYAPSKSFNSLSIGQLDELAKQRSSVRWFEDRPVDRQIVDRAISVGIEAPSACNRQPYRFEVFDDRSSIDRVGGIPMGTKGYLHQVPGLIVVVGDQSAFFDERDRHLIYVDSSLAIMGVLLGLESQWVSSCCINWPDISEKEEAMAELLGLQPFERVIMLIAYGYSDQNGLTPYSAKRNLDSVREYRSL